VAEQAIAPPTGPLGRTSFLNFAAMCAPRFYDGLPACAGEARTTTVAARACRPTPPIDKSDAEKKSGTGIEREPDAERLLARGAFRSFQLLGNFRCGGLLFCQ